MPKFEINYGRDMPEEEEEDEEEDAAFFQALGYLIKSQVPEDNGGVVYAVKPERLNDLSKVLELLKKTVKGKIVSLESRVDTEIFEMGAYYISIVLIGRDFEITDPKLFGKTINDSGIEFNIGFQETGDYRFDFYFDHAVERLGEIDE